MIATIRLGCCALALMAASTSWSMGSAEAGAAKAAACLACHGPLGRCNPAAGYPALRAQHSVYLIKQLNAYSADVRYSKNEKGASRGGDTAVIMHTIAARLTDTDMRDLASYIQGLR